MLNNRHIAAVFHELSALLELAGNEPFRVAAYRRASETLRRIEPPLAELAARHELQAIPGIGEGIAADIEELLATGRLARLDALRVTLPPVLIALMHVPGIGAKTAAALHARLGLPDLRAYETAILGGALRGMRGIGEKREADILSGLRARLSSEGRSLLGTGMRLAAQLMHDFATLLPDVPLMPIGSLRRWTPTIGDVDLLALTHDADRAIEVFSVLPDVFTVVNRTADTVRVRLIDGVESELFVRTPERAGGALLFLTGNKTTATGGTGFREALVARAATQGYALDTSGLHRGNVYVEGDETAAFAALGLPFVPPELREGATALERIATNGVPRLVEMTDIRGDLHTHTTWSDGSATVAQMLAGAHEHGYTYYGISDHSGGLKIANGLNATRLAEQAAEIAATLSPVRVLRSSEVEVHNDGHLDFDDATLAMLDYAIAAVHSNQRGDRAAVTQRTLAAIANPYIDIVAHPTGRLLLHREPMDLDFDPIFAAAAATQTALEINADYHRLDLDASLARRAADAGVVITTNSDAHGVEGLSNLIFGVMTARRAWLRPEELLNCWPADEILARRAHRLGH